MGSEVSTAQGYVPIELFSIQTRHALKRPTFFYFPSQESSKETLSRLESIAKFSYVLGTWEAFAALPHLACKYRLETIHHAVPSAPCKKEQNTAASAEQPTLSKTSAE